MLANHRCRPLERGGGGYAEELNIIMNDRNSDVFNIQDFDEHKKIVSRHLSLVGTDDQYV